MDFQAKPANTFVSERVMTLYLGVSVFVHSSVCAAVHAKRGVHCLECCFCPIRSSGSAHYSMAASQVSSRSRY